MSVNENIRVNIQDDELDAIINKLSNAKLAGGGADDATKRLNELNKKIADTRKAAKEAGINLDDLPTLNRDMRLLAGQMNIPGFREFSSAFFQARRGVRATQLGREARALNAAELAPELAKGLQIQSLVGYAALILYVTKIIYDVVKRVKDGIEQERLQYEDFIRKELDLTHREYLELSKEQSGFASWWDQFQYTVSEEGIQETVMQVFYTTIRETFIRDMEVQFGPIRTQWAKWFTDAQQWYYSGVDP